MNKKTALICWIILYALSMVAFFAELSLPDDASLKITLPIFILFFLSLIGGSVMGIIYAKLKRKETQKPPQYDDRAFQCWLNRFSDCTKRCAILKKTQNKTFTKFGGLPVVPENFIWPKSGEKPISFLLQVDFNEINADGKIDGFPTKGLMYIFADGKAINENLYKPAQGNEFQILFFGQSENLSPAEKPDDLLNVYNECNLCSEIIVTYPDVEDCSKAFEIYKNRPFGGMDDEYDDMQRQNMGANLLGGWASYIQESHMSYKCAPDADEWTLLMQIGSSGENDLIWGDGGTLYFYIRKSDLIDRAFDNVILDVQYY